MPLTPSIPFPPRRETAPVAEPDHPPTVRVPVPVFLAPPRDPHATPPPRSRVRAELLATVEATATAVMPEPGETLFGFTLVEELGRGSFARVFLATQDSLAGRHVAVKVTLRATREPDKLARLQHTNVVPVYSVHEAGTLQVLCMPFFGRRTVGHLLGAFRREHPSRQHLGRRLSHTLRPGSTTVHSLGSGGQAAPAPNPTELVGTPVPLIGDVPAVLRVVAALASGLAHAHARGILHLDIKPANILLADSGEPMLLDFNLAYDTTVVHRDMVGGTVQYMAPEQLLDIRTKGRGGVDTRTDLYSLGVLAYEMLTGTVPFPAANRLAGYDDLMAARGLPFTPASDINPAVTPAVDAVLRKLLAPDPANRYQTAEAVCDDLERHLANRPLVGVREPSVRERFRKWRRRNPGTAARVMAVCLAGLVIASGVALRQQAVAQVEAKAAAQARDARAEMPTLRLDLAVGGDAAAAKRGKDRAAALLAKYGLPDDADWRKQDAVARLGDEARTELAGDLGEVLLLLAHAEWRVARDWPDAARRTAAAEALRLNRAARRCFADDAVPPFQARQFAELAAAAGELDSGEAAGGGESQTARDFFLDGVENLSVGKLNEAAVRLEKAIAAKPDHGAAHFCLAVCRHNLGQSARAIERYDAARVLLPADPRPSFCRGLVFAVGLRVDLAEAEFTKALDTDPTHRESYRNRAIARRALNKLAEAEADLTKGLELDGPAYQFHVLRADVRERRRNKAGAEEDRTTAEGLKLTTDMDFVVRGWARARDKRYDEALADYREAAARNPRLVAAYLNQVRILGDEMHDNATALEATARLTKTFPDYAVGRGARAVILARLGKRDEAVREANAARLLSDDATVTYQIGCVYALLGKDKPADLDLAMGFIKKAFQGGYHILPEFETDPDLDALRGRADFKAFLKAAQEVAR